MKDFRRPSGNGAGRSGGFEKREQSGESRPPRPSYDNRGGYNKYSSNRDSGERREVSHKAVCSECNNTCEVPFRPNGSKPVYCKDCFGKKKGAYPSDNARPEFTPRAPIAREQSSVSESRDPRIGELKAEMDRMQSKLDRILKALESGTPSAPKHFEKPAYVPNTAPKAAVMEKPVVKMVEVKKAVKAVAPVKKEVKKAVVPAASKKAPTKAAAKPAAKVVAKKKK